MKDNLPDYEVELVIVIGKAAKNVKVEEALDYVLGYTGANDVRFLVCYVLCPAHKRCRSRSDTINCLCLNGVSLRDLVSLNVLQRLRSNTYGHNR